MVTTGSISTFNIAHGYTESLLRGMRSSFLADSDYHHLTACENLEDAKMNLRSVHSREACALCCAYSVFFHLFHPLSLLTPSLPPPYDSETDYGAAVSEETMLTPGSLQRAAIAKLTTEFKFLRSQAAEPLSTFLDFVAHEYMIENVMLLLKGTLSGRSITDLLPLCHPLGMFKESTMRSIPTFGTDAKGCADLYQTVLVDTPIGPYFEAFLAESAQSLGSAGEVS